MPVPLPWISVAFCQLADKVPKDRKSAPRTFEMQHTYQYPWEVVVKFVDETKRKGAPDSRVRMTVQDNTFEYWVQLPWWMTYLLGKEMGWRDVVHMDTKRRTRREEGTNLSWREKNVLEEVNEWRADENEPVTHYTKQMWLDVPWMPQIIGDYLLEWYRVKSLEVRKMEEQQLKEYVQKLLESEQREQNGAGSEDEEIA